MTSGHLQFRAANQNLLRFEVERTQFSLAGEWRDEGRFLEVRSLFYFRGEAPHGIATPPERRGPLFTFVRQLEDVPVGLAAIRGFELDRARFEATEVPYPAGVSFGSIHFGLSTLTYTLTWLRDLTFECRADGRLELIGDGSHDLHGAAVELHLELAFDGVWLESSNPADVESLEAFYQSRFAHMGLVKELDRFTDAIVLRAHA